MWRHKNITAILHLSLYLHFLFYHVPYVDHLFCSFSISVHVPLRRPSLSFVRSRRSGPLVGASTQFFSTAHAA